MIGTSLGPYKIIEQLGAGGTGEVYRERRESMTQPPPQYADDDPAEDEANENP